MSDSRRWELLVGAALVAVLVAFILGRATAPKTPASAVSPTVSAIAAPSAAACARYKTALSVAATNYNLSVGVLQSDAEAQEPVIAAQERILVADYTAMNAGYGRSPGQIGPNNAQVQADAAAFTACP